MVAPNDEPVQIRIAPDVRSRERIGVLRLIFLQVLLVSVMALAACLGGTNPAVSVLVGGLIGLSATVWSALVLLRASVGVSAEKLLSALYIGELGKYLFVIAFFAIAFKKMIFVREPHNALLMIGAFAITQVVIWLWPLLMTGVDGRAENRS